VKLVMAKRGGGMGMGGRGGGMQFGKIGLKLDRMNLHALADRQNEEGVEEEDKQAGSFGSFGKKAPPPKPASKPMSDIRNEVDDGATEADSQKEDGEKRPEEEDSMMKVMGFGSFSSTHKSNSTGHEKSAKLRMEEESKRRAMRFDVDTMFKSAAASAQQRNMEANLKLEEEGRAGLQGRKSSFIVPAGEKEKKKEVESGEADSDEEDSDDDAVGPMPPPSAPIEKTKKSNKSQEGDDSEDDDDDEDDDEEGGGEDDPVNRLPWTHEIQLRHGEKAITSLALDPGGARVLSGGIDYELKFWDFAGMDPSLRSFRGKKPVESHAINDLKYSASGDKILVCGNLAQYKVLGRDGDELFESVKGDMYVLDQSRNKGHTARINAGCWHPKIKEEFMTCADDGTMRLWLMENQGKKSKSVIKTKNRKSGLKCHPTSCTYSRDGLLCCGACNDGSIQMWDHRKHFVNTALQLNDAHGFGEPITGVQFGYDNRMLATRSNDSTLKLWDIRNFKKAVNVAEDLYSRYAQTDVEFSPDDRLVVTGTSCDKGEEGGKLIFFDKTTFQRAFEMTPTKSHVIRCTWHPKLNQILVGGGDGVVRVFYDPRKSVRGAMLCIVKKRTEAKQSNWLATQRIITPYALPMFKEDKRRQSTTYRQMIKDRKDPKKSHNPDPPMEHKGTGGLVAAGGSTLHSWMAKQIAVKNKDDHIDPRERILRHAEESKNNPYWISPAYKKTQPVPIFRETDPDEPAEKRSKTVANLAGITGAGGYPAQKPERQTKPTSQLGQH